MTRRYAAAALGLAIVLSLSGCNEPLVGGAGSALEGDFDLGVHVWITDDQGNDIEDMDPAHPRTDYTLRMRLTVLVRQGLGEIGADGKEDRNAYVRTSDGGRQKGPLAVFVLTPYTHVIEVTPQIDSVFASFDLTAPLGWTVHCQLFDRHEDAIPEVHDDQRVGIGKTYIPGDAHNFGQTTARCGPYTV